MFSFQGEHYNIFCLLAKSSVRRVKISRGAKLLLENTTRVLPISNRSAQEILVAHGLIQLHVVTDIFLGLGWIELLGNPRFSQSFLHGREVSLPTPLCSNPTRAKNKNPFGSCLCGVLEDVRTELMKSEVSPYVPDLSIFIKYVLPTTK